MFCLLIIYYHRFYDLTPEYLLYSGKALSQLLVFGQHFTFDCFLISVKLHLSEGKYFFGVKTKLYDFRPPHVKKE